MAKRRKAVLVKLKPRDAGIASFYMARQPRRSRKNIGFFVAIGLLVLGALMVAGRILFELFGTGREFWRLP